MTVTNDPRILLIDSYDSFTYNLASLLCQAIPGCSIHIVKNDEITGPNLLSIAPFFSAVVVGPGPGSPECPQDIGVIKHLWNLSETQLLPVFGVCLGLQSLALEFGAELKRLNVVKHGQISNIIHSGDHIFEGIGEVHAVRYHSLHVSLDNAGDVEPLAWADDGEENGKVVMALRHRTKPFWAVQYHPESVCTDGGGADVLRNFWRLARNWSSYKGRLQEPWGIRAEKVVGSAWPSFQNTSISTTPSSINPRITTSTLMLPGLAVTSICEALGVDDESSDFVMLDSAAQPGRFSIIGCLREPTPKITYFVGDAFVEIRQGKYSRKEELGSLDIWSWIAEFMRARKATGGLDHIPFWGGLIGYLSYEQGVQSVSTTLPRRSPRRHPDVNLVFVERSIVLDTVTGEVVLQSLIDRDEQWIQQTAKMLRNIADSACEEPLEQTSIVPPKVAGVEFPDRDQYISSIKKAKEHLFCGNSYEICLTAPTRILLPKTTSSNRSSSWQLYKTLRLRNPAPHSAYLRLHPSTFLSSSPERFLSFSRPPGITCQLRPIKGTVRKAPGITRAVAEQALSGSVKEVAENLMIVDLIRHDLHGVVGRNVEVKQFCKVEEYKTVWQLVSVIEGQPSRDIRPEMDFGWEVLRRSLPPGSMTGAPKKRSVEILHDLEDHDRGIYSGVLGYWCVGGAGDWAVTIRSCFKYDPQFNTDDHIPTNPSADSTHPSVDRDEWWLGAGGAITALSDPDAEWDEMMVKVESVLRAFNVPPSSST